MAGMPRRRIGMDLLDQLYAVPEEWAIVLNRLAGGKPLAVVLEERCITWGAWALWSRENPDAVDEIDEASRGYANRAVYEARDLADQATPENVAVAKLQGDRRLWIAERQDRKQWGSRETNGGSGGITVNLIQFSEAQVLSGAPHRVIESHVASPLLETLKETTPA